MRFSRLTHTRPWHGTALSMRAAEREPGHRAAAKRRAAQHEHGRGARPEHVAGSASIAGACLRQLEHVHLAVLQERPVACARLHAVGAGPGVELITVVPPDELVRARPAAQDVLAAVRDQPVRSGGP